MFLIEKLIVIRLDQKFPFFLQYPKVHRRINNTLPQGSNLSHVKKPYGAAARLDNI
jgi:hypothetical protein